MGDDFWCICQLGVFRWWFWLKWCLVRLCETLRDEGKIQIRTICLVVHKRCVYELLYHDTYLEISPMLMQTRQRVAMTISKLMPALSPGQHHKQGALLSGKPCTYINKRWYTFSTQSQAWQYKKDKGLSRRNQTTPGNVLPHPVCKETASFQESPPAFLKKGPATKCQMLLFSLLHCKTWWHMKSRLQVLF